MSDRTQAREWASKFIELYQKTLPNFNHDITSPRFGKAELSKDKACKEAQLLYNEFKSRQRSGWADFSTDEMYTDDILYRLGVKLSRNSGLKTCKNSPYNPETLRLYGMCGMTREGSNELVTKGLGE